VREFAQSFLKTDQKVDMLVNNAGILFTDRENSVDGIESCHLFSKARVGHPNHFGDHSKKASWCCGKA
jgi:NAD(P)-dependent dehydrogenase (short-subunit alcohol dehydrogenase family)